MKSIGSLDPPVKFFRNPSCRDCPLWDGPKTVCVPTVPFQDTPPRRDLPALLVVGEAPGGFEDQKGVPFIGPSGQHLRRTYLQPGLRKPSLWNFQDHCDIYLSNSVRCRPPGNATPSIGPIRKCRHFLENDLRSLSSLYKRVIILAVGATAARSLLDCSLTEALRHQPREFKLNGTSYLLFLTFHPALLLPGRDPAKINSVLEHLQLLLQFLQTPSGPVKKIDPKSLNIQIAPDPIPTDRLVLDIETYGILDFMPPQRYMHPQKSGAFDLIAPGTMIPLVGIAWSPKDIGAFFPSNPEHLEKLRGWLRILRDQGGTLQGANIKFDLTYLRHCYPDLPGIHDGSLLLEDAFILSYLHNSQRPERSLKALTGLFGICEYPKAVYEGLVRYAAHDDPNLLLYNALDCASTWVLIDTLKSKIQEDFGGDSSKLSPYSQKTYSDLLWLLIRMGEAGVTLDRSKLEALEKHCKSQCSSIEARVREEWSASVGGKGSSLFANLVVEKAASQAGLLGHWRLKTSDKMKRVSTSKKNINFILPRLPKGSSYSQVLRDIQDHRKNKKLLTTYISSRLKPHPEKDNGCPIWKEGTPLGITYPDWFPVPSGIGRGDRDKKEGGTLHCRVTCSRPPLQTDPPEIRDCITGRFSPGYLFVADLDQIEYRVLAILSGDEVLLDIFRTGKDIHKITANAIFSGKPCSLDPETKRQVGKKTNYLVVYGGGPGMLQQTLVEEVGLDVSRRECQEFLFSYSLRYPRVWTWREKTIGDADKTGFVQIPFIGASRALPKAGSLNKEPYSKVAINFFPQVIAAWVLLSGATLLDQAFQSRKMKAITGLQIYDSLYIECPLPEAEIVRNLIKESLTGAPYWHKICKLYDREVPLEYELKETRIER